MRYAIVIGKAGENFSGYSPDLPGCVATGATVEETENEMVSAIPFHLDGLRLRSGRRTARGALLSSNIRHLKCSNYFSRPLVRAS